MTPAELKQKREQAENLIYSVYDKIDPSGTNSDYYRKIFATMTDNDFLNFCKRRLPFRVHIKAFNVEPKMYDIAEAFKILKVPMLERVKLPYVYEDSNGNPVESEECLVIYIHIKRMKQMITKKNHTSMNIEKRDQKTGLLVSDDKGGKETDREFESLATMGLEATMAEFARPKADAINAINQMSNVILNTGRVSMSDLQIANDDSLGKKMLNVYFLGAHIASNLILTQYMTPYTYQQLENRRKIERA